MENSDAFPGTILADSSRLLAGVQFTALITIALVAGATFGIWRGYNPTGFSAATFLEVHKGSVGGLNTLLPVLGLVANLTVLVLAIRSFGSPSFTIYVITIALLIAAALITRFGNQPINAMVMGWTVDTMPTNWAALRDTWWTWHVARTAASVGALGCLTIAIFSSRSA